MTPILTMKKPPLFFHPQSGIRLFPFLSQINRMGLATSIHKPPHPRQELSRVSFFPFGGIRPGHAPRSPVLLGHVTPVKIGVSQINPDAALVYYIDRPASTVIRYPSWPRKDQMKELKPSEFHNVTPLFDKIGHSAALVFSVLEGSSPGRVFVDDLKSPRVALLFSHRHVLLHRRQRDQRSPAPRACAPAFQGPATRLARKGTGALFLFRSLARKAGPAPPRQGRDPHFQVDVQL